MEWVVNKADAIKDVENGKTKFEWIEELDSKVHIYGNTGLVTTLEKTSAQIGGHPITWSSAQHLCVRQARGSVARSAAPNHPGSTTKN
jgi:hypothetical protein